MFSLIKIAGLSAVLSAGLVAAHEAPAMLAEATIAKTYTDRVAATPEAPRRTAEVVNASVASDAMPDCRAETWPYVSPNCINAAGAPVRRVARTITVEQRAEPNTSTLVRMPAPSR